MTKQETWKLLEEAGRAALEKRADDCQRESEKHLAAAADCAAGVGNRQHHLETAQRLRERAGELSFRAADDTRYLWRVDVHGRGSLYVVGTSALAEGVRAAESPGMAAMSSAEKLREAVAGECDGEWTGDAEATLVAPEVGCMATAKTRVHGRDYDVVEGGEYRVTHVSGRDDGTLVRLAETGAALWSARRFYFRRAAGTTHAPMAESGLQPSL